MTHFFIDSNRFHRTKHRFVQPNQLARFRSTDSDQSETKKTVLAHCLLCLSLSIDCGAGLMFSTMPLSPVPKVVPSINKSIYLLTIKQNFLKDKTNVKWMDMFVFAHSRVRASLGTSTTMRALVSVRYYELEACCFGANGPLCPLLHVSVQRSRPIQLASRSPPTECRQNLPKSGSSHVSQLVGLHKSSHLFDCATCGFL